VTGTAAFRVPAGMEAAEWDPATGKMSHADLQMTLAPYESKVLVFSKEKAPAAAAKGSGGTVDLSGGWTVTFPGAASQKWDTLRPWTEVEGRKFYSGTATYERTFQVNAAGRYVVDFGTGTAVDPNAGRRAANGMRAWLESPVREAAQVYVTWPRPPALLRSRIIGYAWDTTAPAGSTFRSEKTGTVTYIILRSGTAEVGRWREERRDVRADFRAIYGEDPPDPGAITLSIDSNDTHTRAESLIGPLRFSPS